MHRGCVRVREAVRQSFRTVTDFSLYIREDFRLSRGKQIIEGNCNFLRAVRFLFIGANYW